MIVFADSQNNLTNSGVWRNGLGMGFGGEEFAGGMGFGEFGRIGYGILVIILV